MTDTQQENIPTADGMDGKGDSQTEPESLDVKCVLLDIEGTICPISFVKDTLFPYALKALPSVLATHWDSAEFLPYRDAFPEETRTSPETLQAYVEQLTRDDVKVACHKNLQGYLWENGYKTGAYATPLFPDVAPRLKEWKEGCKVLAIYSSGSVFAQKLLFGHVKVEPDAEGGAGSTGDGKVGEESRATAGRKRSIDDAAGPAGGETEGEEPPSKKVATDGSDERANKKQSPSKDAKSTNGLNTEDLQYLISDWYDTTNAGPKKEKASYEKIAHALKLPPADILFLTDSVEEYDAALAAGLKVGLMERPGNPPLRKEERDRCRLASSLQDVRLLIGTDE